MGINVDRTLSAMILALDLAALNSIENTNITEKISNIEFSEHKFLHHSKRATYIALEIAKELCLGKESTNALYVSSLLHDIGAINAFKKSHSVDSFIKDHCTVGAAILSASSLFQNISKTILYHHENWDGSGPMALKGSEIPIESQIVRISDLLELLFDEKKSIYTEKEKLIQWITSKRDIVFSPTVVNAFIQASSKDIFWFNIETIPTTDFILDTIAPKISIELTLKEFEAIAYIFANIIDDKSSFTARHSREISELCYKVSKYIGYPEEKCIKMKIAGLLHDIGKLAIPASVLNKGTSLTFEEFSMIKSHVYYTKLLLDRIGDIPEICDWAANHHEKLNGKGYPRSLDASDLSEEARILGVCDIFQALSEDRPYRKGLSSEQTFSILENMVKEGLICGQAVNWLKKMIYS